MVVVGSWGCGRSALLRMLAGLDEVVERGIEAALASLEPGTLLTKRVELNPWFRSRRLADHCAARGILLTYYEPLARGRVGSDPTLQRIAQRHGATPEQVALAWELACGCAAIQTFSKRERIAWNLAAQGLTLPAAELAAIDTPDRGVRSIGPNWGRTGTDRVT